MRRLIALSLILSFTLATSLTGCSAFGPLRPAITAAALTLLVELEALLREYESAALPQKKDPSYISVSQASQDALYRNISNLLDQCHDQIPAKRLREYHARLKAASARNR